MADLKIGTVTHYFDKIGVAVVDLIATLTTGETIRIGDPGFTQKVTSIQVEHNQIESAGNGDSIGLKVDQPVKSGDQVLRVNS